MPEQGRDDVQRKARTDKVSGEEAAKIVRGERDRRAGVAQASVFRDEIEDTPNIVVGEYILRRSDQTGEQVREGVAEDFFVGVITDGQGHRLSCLPDPEPVKLFV